jgi:hypothetical protein
MGYGLMSAGYVASMREDLWSVAWGLDRLAGLAMEQGQAKRAARLFGAATALREATGP